MPNGSITIYKLIILYTLSKVDSPLPPGVISDYITDRGYTNYFNLQNAFGELLLSATARIGCGYCSILPVRADRSLLTMLALNLRPRPNRLSHTTICRKNISVCPAS